MKFLLVFLFLFNTLYTTGREALNNNIPYTNKEIKIDGNLEEWDVYLERIFEDTSKYMHAPPAHPFSIDYPPGYEYIIPPPKSPNKVNTKICWDLNYLYFGIQVEDGHLFCENIGKEENPKIYLNDGIEIYIDTQNDSKDRMDINDYQFIIDIENQKIVFKGNRELIKKNKEYAVPKDYGQNIIFDSKLIVDGEINDSLSKAKGFVLEIRIPFAAIGIIPSKGKKIKLDICNNDVDYYIREATVIDRQVYLTKVFSINGINDCGFPDTWLSFVLIGKISWMEKISYHTKTKWFWYELFVLFLIFILFSSYIYLRIQTQKKQKHRNAKLNIIAEATNTKENISYEQKILQKALHVITKNKDTFYSTQELATILGISRRKFQEITRNELQCTPTNFIHRIKLNQAADFLKNKQGNVSEATYEFGFSDPAYFSKIFKKQFGISPSKYYQKAQKDNIKEKSF
jgi:AraC-like DNA-binding protein